MPKQYSNLFIVDDLLKRGKLASARRELKRAAGKKLPREAQAHLASLMWRARLPELGARLLAKVVRSPSDVPLKDRATAQEKTIYAGCLTQLGAIDEALLLLATISPKECPLSLFVTMTARVARWDYRASISVIEEYLKLNPEPYQAQVARVNLAAAYLFESGIEPARALLADLARELATSPNGRLYAYVLELHSMLAWIEKDWERMRHFLSLTGTVLNQTDTIDGLMLKKWQAVLALSEDPSSKAALARLRKARQTAEEVKHPETARDCDMFEAVLTKNEDLLWHLYFGTPFGNYREKLLKRFGPTGSIPKHYDWRLGEWGKALVTLDLVNDATPDDEKKQVYGVPGGTFHRLLSCLAGDFYRPHSMSSLHAEVYPGEFFNPVSTAVKVHMLILRVRRWANDQKVPLRIVRGPSGYFLTATAPIKIRVNDHLLKEEKFSDIAPLKEKWSHGTFSLRDAQAILNRPGRTVRRMLKYAVEEGELERTGAARAVRYRFKA